MAKNTYGTGSIFLRGDIWWVQVSVDNQRISESSKSTKKSDALKLRDKLLAKKHRGEITGGRPDKVLIGELLDDVLKSDIEESTRYIWKLVVEKNLRPSFGKVRAARLSTDLMDKYRDKRTGEGCSDATVNRELSIMRTAFHNARKRTPPKVNVVPYFPMVKETTVRKGFLTDAQYSTLRDELPKELKSLFVCAYITGIRKQELLDIRWPQVEFESGIVALEPDETKNREGRSVPILEGDMRELPLKPKESATPIGLIHLGSSIGADDRLRTSVVHGTRLVKNEVPALLFHDLRRTAVRNMRRAGVPQVIRMKISGHKTDSMERRYNIVDADDLSIAKEFMERRMKATKNVAKV
jgi:integrase